LNALARRRQPRVLILVLLGLALALIAPGSAAARPPAADFWGLQTAGMLTNPSYAPDETAAMKALGIHTVRMTIFWSDVQPGNGTCGGGPGGPRSWTKLDGIFRKAAEDGITIHANLGARRDGCSGYQTAPSQEYNEWIDPVNGFARALIDRYGAGGQFWSENPTTPYRPVKVWEVGNEENYSVFAPSGGPNPTGYAKYLVDTAIALRSKDPNATVLIGGLAPGGWVGSIAPTTFISQMYAGAGSGGYSAEELDWAYNGVAVHPYSLTDHHGYKSGSNRGEHSEEVLADTWAIRNYLNNNGDANKTLWITEVGWPVGTFPFMTEDPTQQARDLWETLGRLWDEADSLKLQYVGWYLFEDRACGTCGWDDRAGLREYGGAHPIRYSWCAYSHLSGSYACPFVPKEGFITHTTMTEPKTQNGQPGSVSFTGTVSVTNIPGEPVTNLVANVKFFKQNSQGEYVLKSTDQPTVVNGQFAVTNRPVGVGNWKVQTVFPEQGNFKKSETGLHPFTIKATSLCPTETFLTPGTVVNGQPGFISLKGTVNVPNPDCGEVNGQYLNVNYYKKNPKGEYVLDSTDHPVVYGGAWSEVNRPVGTGSWKVKAVFPQQDWFNTSSSGEHTFSIATNGWHIDNLGGTFTADPDISSQGAGKLDVFGRGAENALWIKSFPVNNGWGNWVYMGGSLASGPGAVSWSNGRIDVVMRDGSNNVSHWYWGGGGWAADNLGGPISSDVDISSWGVNRLDVFARGTNNHLLHKYWGGAGWSGWEDMGGNLAGGPGAVSWGSGRIDVVARMSDNTIGHWYWGGAGWAYDNLGGTLTSDPDIASQGAGKLDVFARGTDNGLWHKWYTTSYGQWSNWEPMGNTITSGPGAVSWGNGRVDVVARGANNSLEHWWYQQ
jgi:hypothetical protein